MPTEVQWNAIIAICESHHDNPDVAARAFIDYAKHDILRGDIEHAENVENIEHIVSPKISKNKEIRFFNVEDSNEEPSVHEFTLEPLSLLPR